MKMEVDKGNYYFMTGKLDNTVHDITEDDLEKIRNEFLAEKNENIAVTSSSYNGETYYGHDDTPIATFRESLYRDPKTAGLCIQYPHGTIIQQSHFRHYYRGENQIYAASIPTLSRSLQQYEKQEEKELFRLVADMRIAEFSAFLKSFNHVRNWRSSDILYEALAQHYGLETGWLDFTTDFDVALFFATCRWDSEQGVWLPLTRKDTERSEQTKYGMIFHMPSWYMDQRWCAEIQKFSNLNSSAPMNLIYPIGFQPFMRCSMQNGYGVYMKKGQPLQEDIGFEKLRFRHNESLSKRVYERMNGGKLVYPHEGLTKAISEIKQIAKLNTFSEEAFSCALYRSAFFRKNDSEQVRNMLRHYSIAGQTISITRKPQWYISGFKRKRIDRSYLGFDVESFYNIRVLHKRIVGPNNTNPGTPMYQPYMLSDADGANGLGFMDYRPTPPNGEVSIQNFCLMKNLFTLMTRNAKSF